MKKNFEKYFVEEVYLDKSLSKTRALRQKKNKNRTTLYYIRNQYQIGIQIKHDNLLLVITFNIARKFYQQVYFNT